MALIEVPALTHGDELYLIWTYETEIRPYVWPPVFDPKYPEIVLRGSARMIPGMKPYIGTGAEVNRRPPRAH